MKVRNSFSFPKQCMNFGPFDLNVFPNKNFSFLEKVEQVQLSNQEVEVSQLHNFSMLSGPILACIEASFFFLIPSTNVLDHPEKWHEFHIIILFTSFPLLCWVLLVIAEVWAKFPIGKKLHTFFILLIICYIGYVIGTLLYYYIWTNVLEFVPPMPFSYYVIGSICFAGMAVALWLR